MTPRGQTTRSTRRSPALRRIPGARPLRDARHASRRRARLVLGPGCTFLHVWLVRFPVVGAWAAGRLSPAQDTPRVCAPLAGKAVRAGVLLGGVRRFGLIHEPCDPVYTDKRHGCTPEGMGVWEGRIAGCPAVTEADTRLARPSPERPAGFRTRVRGPKRPRGRWRHRGVIRVRRQR